MNSAFFRSATGVDDGDETPILFGNLINMIIQVNHVHPVLTCLIGKYHMCGGFQKGPWYTY